MPHRERYLFVCTNRRDPGNPKGSCAAKGSEALLDALKARLFEKGGHKRLRVVGSGCLDLCEIGASIVVEPDHVAYGRVTMDDVDDIIDAALEGRVVERLVVHGKKGTP